MLGGNFKCVVMEIQWGSQNAFLVGLPFSSGFFIGVTSRLARLKNGFSCLIGFLMRLTTHGGRRRYLIFHGLFHALLDFVRSLANLMGVPERIFIFCIRQYMLESETRILEGSQ